MGCCGEREKASPLESQKWAYITLSDFKATSGLTYFAYAWLWIMAMVGVAVYAADTFTAVNLLVFDKWSSQIKPAVPIKYSKWIFAGCILFSWILVVFEWIRAIRVIRRGGVAESYLDYLAANAQSMRGQGWKRFLVFTELTKSKKRVDYVAFFIYFAFKGAIRIVLAEGPRQVINAITLYSVMDAGDLVHGVSADGESPWQTFGRNIEHLANTNREEAVILFAMLFTLVLWIISAICLILAVILYLVFMWHYIPQRDGHLHRYVRRKIDKRLERIVEKKVQSAIEEEERQRQKFEAKMAKKGDRPMQPLRQPTLPQMGPSPDLRKGVEKLPDFGIRRQDTSTTVSTLPPYSSQPPTRNVSSSGQSPYRQPTLPDLNEGRPSMPTRTNTQGSAYTTASHEMNAPLLSNAGYAGEISAPPSVASLDRPVPPIRSMTSSTQGSQRTNNSRSDRGTPGPPRSYTPMDRPGTSQSQRPFPPGPGRTLTPMQTPSAAQSQRDHSRGPPRAFTPMDRPYTAQSQRPYSPGPPMRTHTTQTFTSGASTDRQQSHGSVNSSAPPTPANPYFQPQDMNLARNFSPTQREPTAPGGAYEMTTQPAPAIQRSKTSESGYKAFSPAVLDSNGHISAHDRERSGLPSASMLAPQVGAPHSSQQPSVAAYGPPGLNGNYFGHVVETGPPLRQHQQAVYQAYSDHVPSSVHNGSVHLESTHTSHERVPSRAVSGYGDILDAYAGHGGTDSFYAPGGGTMDGLRSKSPSPDFVSYGTGRY
ncbi:hypothetical protein K431DRAFT_229055 [Polychaeton citri CBS 116435]|uniref:Uncharacterized protein n=1 Tax=Polychaeton citri CBS 116435 TaxID=1314669 RepID=A0A9P4UM51_9PEZI|nr:hypothetical protein K431DRAFT_229055 [Polychaeton citri CBS 116435]